MNIICYQSYELIYKHTRYFLDDGSLINLGWQPATEKDNSESNPGQMKLVSHVRPSIHLGEVHSNITPISLARHCLLPSLLGHGRRTLRASI